MSIIGKINELKIKIINNSSYKQYDIDEILAYINSFPEPKTNIERSFFQYKCNSKLYGVKKGTAVIRNIVCFLPFWVLLLKKGRAGRAERYDYIFIADEHKMDIIPEKYKNSYLQLSRAQGWLLGKKEKQILSRLWRKYPFSYYFLLKNLVKLANYNWAIETYRPKAVLCSCEYSFTSSFLTEYCNSRRIPHINIMHGYNMVDLKCPFSTFDIMSIWDSFFIKAYEVMRCGTKEFEIEKPSCIRLKKTEVNNDIPVLKYYTQNFVKTTIPTLKKLRMTAEKNRMRLVIRCHPAYPFDQEDLEEFSTALFEDARQVNIEQSINHADYVIARNSTVLYQASQIDKKILIDDVSIPQEYIESRKKGAFLWENSNTKLLSEFLNNPDRF